MRAASALAEHLGALIVTGLIVLWVTLLAQQYQVQVAPLQAAVASRYAARTALAAHPGVGKITIWLAETAYQVTIREDGTLVEVAGEKPIWFAFSDDPS
ncbi:hypothetical protein ACFQ3L_00960 [Lacticaseibacillus jixianensis]|uniref:Uncharacterized protein n=1 Tax=Lacticaseibacillus jixianensis TaxID=2486012 RepID=A0ABW4B7I4_9LACO|nr:hypothetical protein [Lacticaseibacillus jixianensis]